MTYRIDLQDSPENAMAAQVLRKVAAENANALVPHYSALIPSIVSLLQQTQGPTKLAGDRTLGRVLQVTSFVTRHSSPCMLS